MLEPQLPENLAEFKRLGNRMLQVAFGALVCSSAILWFLPSDRVMFVWIPFFVIVIGVFGGIEFKRVRVFRRDLRDRQSMSGVDRS